MRGKDIDRLAAYEDAGLEPEKIEQLKGEVFGLKVDKQEPVSYTHLDVYKRQGLGIKAGYGIEAGGGIEAGDGIEAGGGIKAGCGYGIYAGLRVKVTNREYRTIRAKNKPDNIMCGEWVEQ